MRPRGQRAEARGALEAAREQARPDAAQQGLQAPRGAQAGSQRVPRTLIPRSPRACCSCRL